MKRGVFAKASMSLKFDETVPVEPFQVLAARRYGDQKVDLWTTFNVIQENLTEGGLRYVLPPTPPRVAPAFKPEEREPERPKHPRRYEAQKSPLEACRGDEAVESGLIQRPPVGVVHGLPTLAGPATFRRRRSILLYPLATLIYEAIRGEIP